MGRNNECFTEESEDYGTKNWKEDWCSGGKIPLVSQKLGLEFAPSKINSWKFQWRRFALWLSMVRKFWIFISCLPINFAVFCSFCHLHFLTKFCVFSVGGLSIVELPLEFRRTCLGDTICECRYSHFLKFSFFVFLAFFSNFVSWCSCAFGFWCLYGV